jgi:hypothetical protein
VLVWHLNIMDANATKDYVQFNGYLPAFNVNCIYFAQSYVLIFVNLQVASHSGIKIASM